MSSSLSGNFPKKKSVNLKRSTNHFCSRIHGLFPLSVHILNPEVISIHWLTVLSDLIWGGPTIGAFLLLGVVLSFQTRFIQIRKLGMSFRLAGQPIPKVQGSVSPFQAVCTALAATVGTGNIAGVAGAIALGGPGAVFWMWLSAFFGMSTKYSEILLAMRYRIRSHGHWRGGPMYYILRGLHKPKLAALFCTLALPASLGIGNMVQVHTIASSLIQAIPSVSPQLVRLGTGLICAAAVASVTVGGITQISAVMERLLPTAAFIYIASCCTVLAINHNAIFSVFQDILQGAFTPQAVLGGGSGIALRHTIRMGVSRGIFSNEAGLGSTPISHASAENTPEQQGLMGILEVFIDTIVICSLTAFTILVSGAPVPYGCAVGTDLVIASLSTVFGHCAAWLITLCLSLLSLGTLICWHFYGLQCAVFLFGQTGDHMYPVVFLCCIFLGAAMDISTVWILSELCNGLMAVPNLLSLLLLRREVTP